MQETLRLQSNNYLMNKIRKGDHQSQTEDFKTHELLEVADE